MEKRGCEIFHSYQPVWNTFILPILWGDNLMDNYDVINLSSAHLAKPPPLTFIPHLQQKQQHSQLLASGTKWMSKYTPINYALFSAECRSETPNASPARPYSKPNFPPTTTNYQPNPTNITTFAPVSLEDLTQATPSLSKAKNTSSISSPPESSTRRQPASLAMELSSTSPPTSKKLKT